MEEFTFAQISTGKRYLLMHCSTIGKIEKLSLDPVEDFDSLKERCLEKLKDTESKIVYIRNKKYGFPIKVLSKYELEDVKDYLETIRSDLEFKIKY